MQSYQLAITWRGTLVDENSSGYTYPSKFTKFFRDRYQSPAVYRWRIHPATAGGKETVYIGEADNLAQRIQWVLTPPKAGNSGQTNQRLKRRFDKAIADNKRVFLDIADFDPFEINGVFVFPTELSDKFKRCLIENLCLCTDEKKGFEILNKRLDPRNKTFSKFLQFSPRAQRERVK